ncbi:reverse transcriptase domain-containing protein [Tanacetum coccineum]
MADNRTMAQLLKAPTEGYEDAIRCFPEIHREQLLKQAMVYFKSCFKISNFLDMIKKTPCSHPIFQQDHFYYESSLNVPSFTVGVKLSFSHFPLEGSPHPWFSELHQLDTIYNALNSNDQDIELPAAVGETEKGKEKGEDEEENEERRGRELGEEGRGAEGRTREGRGRTGRVMREKGSKTGGGWWTQGGRPWTTTGRVREGEGKRKERGRRAGERGRKEGMEMGPKLKMEVEEGGRWRTGEVTRLKLVILKPSPTISLNRLTESMLLTLLVKNMFKKYLKVAIPLLLRTLYRFFSSPSFNPSENDFLMEEIDAFLEHDDSIHQMLTGTYDSEGDNVYLEELICVGSIDFSKIARPMTHLLEKETPFIFSKECIEAFETLKMKLTQAPILVAPDWDLPFEIMCDASDFAVGAYQEATHDAKPRFAPVDFAAPRI